MKKNIIIIGAGPAGLTAAYELTKYPQYQVTVLEADAVAGGISRTVLTNGNRMDLGGHRFFSKDQRVMDWWFSIFAAQGKPSLDGRMIKMGLLEHLEEVEDFVTHGLVLDNLVS